MVQLAKDDADRLFIEYGSTGFQLTTNGKVDVMNAVTQEVKTLTAFFPNLPFKEQDVYWLSNDGTGQIDFLTARPFRLWQYTANKGFRLRYEMKDWDKPGASSTLDYHATGPYCMFGMGKVLLKIFNQATQYLVTEHTVVPFAQHDAQRSLPVGFTSQADLLITYTTAAEPKAFNIGMITHGGESKFPAGVKGFNTDSLKAKYWYQAANSTDGRSSIFLYCHRRTLPVE